MDEEIAEAIARIERELVAEKAAQTARMSAARDGELEPLRAELISLLEREKRLNAEFAALPTHTHTVPSRGWRVHVLSLALVVTASSVFFAIVWALGVTK